MKSLTPRELDCISLHLRGLDPQEISRLLGISRSSVRTYLVRANHKLDTGDDS
jgi:DNA-binding CsgD family transcriptional regulator